MKKILSVFLTVLLIGVFCMNAFAFSHSTYGDLSQSSSQATNLLSYAMNYDSFLYSDFVIYQSEQYSYYLVWTDKLTYNGSRVSADGDVQFISYIRNGLNYSYTYNYGVSNDFSLNVNHMVVSNVDGLGFRSSFYNEFVFFDNFKNFSIFGLSAILLIALCNIRRLFNK